MVSLVQSGMYGVINIDYTTTNGLHIIQFISEEYTVQNNTTIDGQVIFAGELVGREQYICYMQENSDCYWKQQPLQQTIIVPTCIILHPRLNVVIIRGAKYTPKNVYNRIQAKNIHKDILFV